MEKKCHVFWEKFQLNKFTTDILIFVVSTPSSSDQLIFPCLILHYRPAFTPCWRSFLQAVALIQGRKLKELLCQNASKIKICFS